jgi:hypothetical protein
MISPSSPSQATDDNMADLDAQYFNAVRADVDAFVAEHFHLRGTIRLHRAAFGPDILRAPVNVILSPILIVTRILAWLCRRVRLNMLADWLGARRVLLRTAVAGRVETRVVGNLLKIPLPQGKAHDSAALSRAILEAPQFRRVFRSKADIAEVNALRDTIAGAIAEYSGARSAVADITTAIIALVVGGLLFQAVTPGMISMAPGMAQSIALDAAVADFPLGQVAGSIWFGVFSTSASPWLLAFSVTGLILAGSVIGSFAGILADPVQARLGIHRRRLLRFLAAIEDALAGSGTNRYAAREHFYARFMDLWDVGVSALRFFRS